MPIDEQGRSRSFWLSPDTEARLTTIAEALGEYRMKDGRPEPNLTKAVAYAAEHAALPRKRATKK